MVASGGQMGIGANSQELWESPASKDVNTEAEESTVLGAVTKQRLVKTQQTEKTYLRAMVNCRVCELARAL
jgi:hypothetical protein